MTIHRIPVALSQLVDGLAPIPRSAHLTWDPAAPTDVELHIAHGGQETTWLIGRDLLTEGLRQRAGDYDIRIKPYRAGEMHMLRIDFSSNTGHAEFITTRQPIADFLRITWKTVSVLQQHDLVLAAVDDFDWASGVYRTGALDDYDVHGDRVADDAGEAA